MKRSTLSLCLWSCTLTLLALPSAATAEQSVSAEEMFVTQVGQESLAAVEMSKLAQTRSTDEAVKAFAARMVTDYGKIGEELSTLLNRTNFMTPARLDGDHARIVHSVSAKPPSEFDTEYAKRMVTSHEKMVTSLKDAAALSDKKLVQFASRVLPVVQAHRALMSSLPVNIPANDAGARPGTLNRSPVDAETRRAAAADAVAADPTAADHAAPGVIQGDAAAADAATHENVVPTHPPMDR